MKSIIDKLQNLFLSNRENKKSIKHFSGDKTEEHSFKEGPILKLLLVFVGPAVLGLLINVLYNVVDRMFVGQFVGAEGLSAVTMVFPISIFKFSFILLLGSGAGVLIAKYLGEGRLEKAEEVLGNMLAGLFIVSLCFTITGLLFYKEILVLLGAEGPLLQQSAEYLFIIVLGFPLSFFIALEFTCRAEGNPHLPAKLILLSSLINIGLDYVFMKIFGMGIKGAALATIIAQATNAIFLMGYYLKGKSLVKFYWKQIRFKRQIILPILSVGLAPFIMDSAVSLQNAFANHLLLQSGGVDAVASMGIIFGINVLFMMTALGTGDGMQPIVSFNFGAKRYDRAAKTLEYVLKFILFVAFIGILVIELFPDPIISVFIDGDENILVITHKALNIFVWSIPFYMVQVVIARYFQALQKNTTATFLAVLRPILLFIPISYVLNELYGFIGIWFAFIASDALAAFIAFLLIKKYSIYKLKMA